MLPYMRQSSFCDFCLLHFWQLIYKKKYGSIRKLAESSQQLQFGCFNRNLIWKCFHTMLSFKGNLLYGSRIKEIYTFKK